jgi:hypothetical protein
MLDSADVAGRQSHVIAKAGMQLVPEDLVPEDRRIFGSLSVEENIILVGLMTRSKGAFERIYEMFPRLKERRGSGAAVGRRAADAGDRSRAGARPKNHSARRSCKGIRIGRSRSSKRASMRMDCY